MKTIKIKFVGYWKDMKPESQMIYRILSEYYDVKICDEPDYIICSCFSPYYEYCKYPQVRIMAEGENFIPDFNFIDYVICPYPIHFQDRCFYKPGCFDSFGHALSLEKEKEKKDLSFINNKIFFANFIASHESEYGIRGDFFKKLSQYKRVESPGSYLKNTVDSVVWTDNSKTDFQRKCKFTLCFESTKHEGFVTEKITDAFFADTIPIYYGSDTVKEIFNPKAFINISDFKSWDDAVEYIIKIDNDDKMYLDMINQPILNDGNYFTKLKKSLEECILNIFEQPIEKSYRRSRVYAPMAHEVFIKDCIDNNVKNYSIKKLLKAIFKKIKRK